MVGDTLGDAAIVPVTLDVIETLASMLADFEPESVTLADAVPLASDVAVAFAGLGAGVDVALDVALE